MDLQGALPPMRLDSSRFGGMAAGLPSLLLAGSAVMVGLAATAGAPSVWQGAAVGPVPAEELLRELSDRFLTQDERLADLEVRISAQEEQIRRLELLAEETGCNRGGGVQANPDRVQADTGAWSLWVRIVHLGQVLGRLADPRPRPWQSADEQQTLPCTDEEPAGDCLTRAGCPAGAFPKRTASSPPYFLCLRLEPDDLDATISVFSRWNDGEFMRQALEALLRHTGKDERLVIVDIGANIGALALYFGEILRRWGFRHARILAVEPEPESAALLRAGVALNKLDDMVEVLEAAASDTAAARVPLHKTRSFAGKSLLGPLGFSGDPRADSALVGTELDLPFSTYDVPTVRLEEALAGEDRLDFLKVDVEGHERRALLGLGRLLSAVSVAIVEFRVWALDKEPDGPAGLLRMLHEAGLSLWCMGPCQAELSAVLRPEEQATFIGSYLDPREFDAFVVLCGRLREARRDFDLLAVALDKLQAFMLQRDSPEG